ncbi:MAG: hypothetical protein GY945_14975 [Rhodobacteraceae bacterium]|nr:hypothetical protein [Paracoccaceae bacterium]
MAIENHNNTSKIKQKELPIAVVGSKIATIGNADIAADDNKYSEVQNIIGRGHHADALHLEGHRKSGRDIFVTDDNDFLSKKAALFKTLGIRVATVDEIDELTQI